MDSAGSYDPYLDNPMGDTDYGETEECSDVCLQSESGSDCEEESPMDVEHPHGDLPSHGHAKSSHSKEPPGHATQVRAGEQGRLAGRHCCQIWTLHRLRPGALERMRLRRSLVQAKRQPHQYQNRDGRRYLGWRGTLPARMCVRVPVSVIVLVPVLPPATLFVLARGGLSGPSISPFGVGLRAAA
ncbi:hypothetical protein P4O66_009076, partial [Electrophorus voltai]